MLKPQSKILGIDDAPFHPEDRQTEVIGTLLRGNGRLEAVLSDSIDVDGLDATETIATMVTKSRHHEHIHAILLDGITYGGLNVLDIKDLHQQTETPVIAVNRDRPDRQRLKDALENVERTQERTEYMERAGTIHEREMENSTLYIQTAGCGTGNADEILETTILEGSLPEPLRVAHLVAAGIKNGASKGGA